jgi:DNA processing protein
MTETEACVALNMVPRLGPVRLRKLLEAFGSPSAVLAARESALRSVPGVPWDTAREVARWRETVDLDAELTRAEKAGARLISFLDDDYPPLLREIHDPPIVLYVMGELLRRDRQAVGVVGTRKPSVYGTDCTKKLSYQLAYAGMTVVSGLARGVDTFAHQAALAAKGRTIAVIGSGLGKIYPPENRELAAKIADGHGAVVSEFPLQTQADKQTFPMRNRIISGLSLGLLVVEAGGRSGALISAAQAAEQGRTVYAVPGRIDHPGALGSNRLLQHGGKAVLSAEDILEDLNLLLPKAPELPPSVLPEGLNEVEKTVLRALEREELIIDQIITNTGLPSHEISSSLLGLEIRGLVKALPGGRFVRIS